MKKIEFEYNGKSYCLEYNRKSVEKTERMGFKPSELNDNMATMLPLLFAGAFAKNHKFIKPDEIEKIYDNITNKDMLIQTLVEMYQDALATLMDEPEEGAKGNIEWTMS